MDEQPGRVAEREYVLGTKDDEIERLGLQHRVWRPRALDAWRRAGFTVGQTLIDLGAGPGHATIDLAGIVGPTGKVIAVDRSAHFLDALAGKRARIGADQIELHELDIDEADLPSSDVHGVWARWIFSFLRSPRAALARAARALRPGGVFVAHEYFDYGAWRLAPESPALERFVLAVMASWRARNGEPDIALHLVCWLKELGFDVVHLSPIVDLVPPTNFVWQWPTTFVRGGAKRLVELRHLTAGEARDAIEAVDAAETASETLLVTPAVAEIIAVKRSGKWELGNGK